MHTYRRSPQGDGNYLYVVGFHSPSEMTNDWTPLEDCKTEKDARALVNYLNGGNSHVNCYVQEA